MPNRPSITVFASPPSLCPVFYEHLEENLPLRSVKWRDDTKTTHLIPELPLKIVQHRLAKRTGNPADEAPRTESGEESDSADPVDEPDRPLVHVAVVQCEDSAAYRGHLKELLLQWQQSLSKYHSARNWLIVHVNPKALPKGKQRLTLFDTVFDKIKADFGAKADGDRCLQLRDENGPVASELWTEMLARLETELLTSFNERLTHVSRLTSSATEAFSEGSEPSDTDFCIFFLFKDTLGRAFESFGLLQQAVAQYDELEADFERYLDRGDSPRDGTAKSARQWLSWFHPDCRAGCVQGAPIGVELDGANFRRHVQKKEVVIFEMRQYILHRQASLLFAMGLPPEAAHRCLKLVLQIVPEMHADWPGVKPLFVRQWAILTCLDVIRCAEAYLRQHGRGLKIKARVKYALLRADLADYAKQRLEEIGLAGQLLPPTFLLGLRSAEHQAVAAEGSQDVSLPAGEVMFPESTFPALKIMRTCAELLPSLNTGIESAAKAAATAIQRKSSGMITNLSPRRPKSRDDNDGDAREGEDEGNGVEVSRLQRRKTTRAFSVAAITSRPALELLQDASLSESGFDFLYMNLCQVAVDSFKQANRMRSSLGLFCDMAALRYCREDWVDAVDQLAVAVRQFRKDRWFELEFRLLQPMILCYEQVRAFDLAVDTLLRCLSADCPPAHITDQPAFAAKLQEYAKSGPEPVTCDADNALAVTAIEEVPAPGLDRRVRVHLCNVTTADLVFHEVTLTYEEVVVTPKAQVHPHPDRAASHDATPPEAQPNEPETDRETGEETLEAPPNAAEPSFKSPLLADAPLVSEVDLASPSVRQGSVTEGEGGGDGALDDSIPASRKPSSAEYGEGELDQMTESVFYDQSESRKWLNTRRTQAQRERDCSFRTTQEVVLPAGSSTSFTLSRASDRFSGPFQPRTLVLAMGRVTLLALHLPPCREDTSVGHVLELDATVTCPLPLIHGVASTVVLNLSTRDAHHEDDTVEIVADGGVLVKLAGSAGSFAPQVPSFKLTAAAETVELVVLLGELPSEDTAVDLTRTLDVRRDLRVTLTNPTMSPGDDATTKVSLRFGVPLRATAETHTLEGQAYIRLELHNLLSTQLVLQRHLLARVPDAKSEGDVGGEEREPEDLNGLLQWPVHASPKQCLSLVWRVPQAAGRRAVDLSTWPNIFSSQQTVFEALFELSIASHPPPSPTLQFYHRVTLPEPAYRFQADLVPVQTSNDHVPTVGGFTSFVLRVSFERAVEFVGDDADLAAALPLGLTYSLVMDNKRWMCSGQVRGQFNVQPTDDSQTIEQSLQLLPLISGLLHLPKVKVHCMQGGEKVSISVTNQHRANQIRVFPGSNKPANRLSVY